MFRIPETVLRLKAFCGFYYGTAVRPQAFSVPVSQEFIRRELFVMTCSIITVATCRINPVHFLFVLSFHQIYFPTLLEWVVIYCAFHPSFLAWHVEGFKANNRQASTWKFPLSTCLLSLVEDETTQGRTLNFRKMLSESHGNEGGRHLVQSGPKSAKIISQIWIRL